jgi:hypothetical protein
MSEHKQTLYDQLARLAGRLEDGVLEWRAAGLKVVAGDKPVTGRA